jgi:hypothetical protein
LRQIGRLRHGGREAADAERLGGAGGRDGADLDEVADRREPLGRHDDLAHHRGAAAGARDRGHGERHRRGRPAHREEAAQAGRERQQLGGELGLHHPALELLGVLDVGERGVERGRERRDPAGHGRAGGDDRVGIEAGELREQGLDAALLGVLLPPRIVDYVVVHELVHLREPHHTPAFWRAVERILPDWERRRRWLAEHGHELLV